MLDMLRLAPSSDPALPGRPRPARTGGQAGCQFAVPLRHDRPTTPRPIAVPQREPPGPERPSGVKEFLRVSGNSPGSVPARRRRRRPRRRQADVFRPPVRSGLGAMASAQDLVDGSSTSHRTSRSDPRGRPPAPVPGGPAGRCRGSSGAARPARAARHRRRRPPRSGPAATASPPAPPPRCRCRAGPRRPAARASGAAHRLLVQGPLRLPGDQRRLLGRGAQQRDERAGAGQQPALGRHGAVEVAGDPERPGPDRERRLARAGRR